MKKIFMLVLVLLLTGCTSDYTLKISNDSFKENINIQLDENELNSESVIDNNGEQVESDNPSTTIIDDNISAFIDKDEYYKKRIVKSGSLSNINLSYNFNADEYSKSYLLNSCFDNMEYMNEDFYYIKATGRFYCLYSDSLDIKINTKNKVLVNNADSIEGNTYIWHITEDNINSVNIEFKVEKGISKSTKITALVIGCIILVGALIFFIIKRIQSKNNEI